MKEKKRNAYKEYSYKILHRGIIIKKLVIFTLPNIFYSLYDLLYIFYF